MSPKSRIRSLRFRNFKAFSGEHSLELRPLTVVFGRNGSGKSVLSRLPLALVAAMGWPESPGLPLRVGNVVFGSSLASFTHGGTAADYSLGFGLVSSAGAIVELDVEVGREPNSSIADPAQWLNRWKLRTGNNAVSLEWDRKAGAYRYSDGKAVEERIRFRGLLPMGPAGTRSMDLPAALFQSSVLHLGPVRSIGAEDFVRSSAEIPLWVGLRGEETRAVLGAHHSQRRDAVVRQVREDILRILGIEIDVRELGEGPTRGTITLARPRGRDTWLDAAEMGTGLQHALPVVVQHAVAAVAGAEGFAPSLIVCEEPEAHLTFAAQAEMADVIVGVVKRECADCLIETHSETFLLRLRRRVADGTLRPEQVGLWWVDDEGGETIPRQLSVAPDGEIEGFPENWFGAALDEVRAIYRSSAR